MVFTRTVAQKEFETVVDIVVEIQKLRQILIGICHQKYLNFPFPSWCNKNPNWEFLEGYTWELKEYRKLIAKHQ